MGAAWCSETAGNQAGRFSGKFAAVQFFQRQAGRACMQSEIDASSPCSELGMRQRVRLPVAWNMLMLGEHLIPGWGTGGGVLWLYV